MAGGQAARRAGHQGRTRPARRRVACGHCGDDV